MTTERRLIGDLPDILNDLAIGPYPEYIDDVLATTAKVRQRPAWTFPERWLPMFDIVRESALVPRVPWRSFAMILLLIAVLIAAAVALVAGSHQRHAAPLFGPARNGLVAYELNGDIYAGDPETGAANAIVTGPETDSAPRFSPDGTRVVFERTVQGDMRDIYVARANGSGLTRVTSKPVALAAASAKNYEFSPDGRSILVLAPERGLPPLAIVQLDGSGTRRVDVSMDVQLATFRPPNGAEILFVGGPNDEAAGHGLFVVDLASGAVRLIVKRQTGIDLTGGSWSPDGSRIAYWMWSFTNTLDARTHTINADGTGDRPLPAPPGAVWNAVAAWSNDGTRIFLVRGYTGDYREVRPAVQPADGSNAGFEIPFAGTAEGGCCSTWSWSPDDSKILGRSASDLDQPLPQVILDPVSRQSRAAPWTSKSDPAWQRLAP